MPICRKLKPYLNARLLHHSRIVVLQVRLWNADSGCCAQVYKQHQNQNVSSSAWMPDSRRFVVGTVDRHDTVLLTLSAMGACFVCYICPVQPAAALPGKPSHGDALCRMAFMYDVEGALIRKIKLLRINDLALTRDGTVMVMVTQEKLIKVQRLSSEGKDVCLSQLPMSHDAEHN